MCGIITAMVALGDTEGEGRNMFGYWEDVHNTALRGRWPIPTCRFHFDSLSSIAICVGPFGWVFITIIINQATLCQKQMMHICAGPMNRKFYMRA